MIDSHLLYLRWCIIYNHLSFYFLVCFDGAVLGGVCLDALGQELRLRLRVGK